MAGRMENILKLGHTQSNRWIVLARVGGGAFGQVYLVFDTKRREEVVMKVEPITQALSKQVLRMEVIVLRKLEGKKHAAKLFGYGTSETFNFIVTEMFSRNLSELRHLSPLQRFSKTTCLSLAIQALEAIRELHSCGFLHRDVKPSNFTVGLTPQTKRNLYLIDFGLARKFLTRKGEVRLPREHPGFRGTLRYASLNSHFGKDLGRHDDLWSLFYMLIEMGTGSLPWRMSKEKLEVCQMKVRCTPEELRGDLPEQTIAFAHTLTTLTYYEAPDYDRMHRLLLEGLGRNADTDTDTPLDWEDEFEALLKEEERKKEAAVVETKEPLTGKQTTYTDAELTTQDKEAEDDEEKKMPQM